MSITTYAELETAITNWTKRADMTTYAPDFITLAESRINREVRSRDMEQRTTSTLDTTSAYLNVPSDLIEIRSVWLTNGGVIRPLQYATPDVLLTGYNSTSSTSEPSWYTIIGDEIRFGPVTDSAYSIELWYWKRLTALSSSLSTLFTNHPDIYLSAALSEAFRFMKDENRADYWEGKYQVIKNQVNLVEEAGRRAQGMQMVAA